MIQIGIGDRLPRLPADHADLDLALRDEAVLESSTFSLARSYCIGCPDASTPVTVPHGWISVLTRPALTRGDHWNPNAQEFMDVMKQHAAFVKQMAGQGNMAIDGMFPLSDQGAKNRIHPLEDSNRL
jgi:hypothetical protein